MKQVKEYIGEQRYNNLLEYGKKCTYAGKHIEELTKEELIVAYGHLMKDIKDLQEGFHSYSK